MTEPSKTIRILVVDDHPIVRGGWNFSRGRT